MTAKHSERGVLTRWIAQKGGQVRTAKHIERARDTHFLESVGRGTSQDRERWRVSGVITNWRVQRGGDVIKVKDRKRSRGTHCLESTRGWTYKDSERKGAGEGLSQTEDRG
jgi:hypothetical protein